MIIKKQPLEELPMHRQPIEHKNHRPIMTRRDLISRGYISFLSAFAAPSLLSMISTRAYGLECGQAAQGAQPIPFLVLDLGGGANFALGNVIVGKAGGQTDFLDDAGSAQLGCPADQNPKNDPTMAVPLNDNAENPGLLFHRNSGFLAGFRAATSPETRQNMDGMILCNRSRDDSAANPINPSYWIQAAGTRGQLVDIVGTGNSAAKGRSQAPQESVNNASSVTVRNAAEAVSLIDPGLLETLLPGQAENIVKAAETMSASSLAKFQAKTAEQQVRDLVQCGYLKSFENLKNFTPDALNPTNDAVVQQALQVNNIAGNPDINNAFNIDNGQDDEIATIAKLVIDGYAGVGTMTMGGYDYHGQGRRNQTIKDFNAGRAAGVAFEMAMRKERPLVMTCITDGGVAARGGADNSAEAAGRFSFSSDSGTRSSTIMLVYNPKGVTSTGIRQLGSFQDGSGAVDQGAHPIANSNLNLTKAIALNYMALSGTEGQFDQVVKGNPFGDIAKSIGFGKLDV